MLRHGKNATNRKYPFFILGLASGYILSYLNVEALYIFSAIVIYLVVFPLVLKYFPRWLCSLCRRKEKLDDESYLTSNDDNLSDDIELGTSLISKEENSMDMSRRMSVDSDLLNPGWLNEALEYQWEFIREATIKSLRTNLDPIFEENTPSYLSYLRLQTLELGDRPPIVKRVRVERKDDSSDSGSKSDDDKGEALVFYADIQTTRGDVKFDIITDSAGPVNLSRITGNPVVVTVENIKFAGTLRIELSNKCGNWPTFKTLSFSFAIRPRFQFDITIAGFSIPGVKDFLKEFIGGTLIKTFVYPHQVSITLGDKNKKMEEDQYDYVDKFCVLCRATLETKDESTQVLTKRRPWKLNNLGQLSV